MYISKYYYPYLGGVENICKYLVEGVSKDFETAVVCFNDCNKNQVDEVNGHKIYRVASQLMIERQALSLSYHRMLKKAIREFQPDIIHFHAANPFPAAVLLMVIPKQVKLVIHWHMDITKQRLIYPLVKPVETSLLKRANLIVVTSPQYKESSIPLRPFLDKVVVVPNAMDCKNFEPKPNDAAVIQKIKEKFPQKIVFFVGRHIEYKGLPYLLKAEPFIQSDCDIVIAGTGPLTPKLKAACKSSRVHFVGRLSDDDLRCFHYAASVFAFPSITRNEAFGVAIAEAQFCNTPVVTFTIPGSGVNWVNLNGVTGFEAPNKDVQAFAKAIDSLLQNESLANQFAIAGKRRVEENFTIEKMAKKMEEEYLQVMRNR